MAKLKAEKYVTTSTPVDLAKVVLKSNLFTFKDKILKQKLGTAKFTSPYSISFMAELEEKFLSEIKLKPHLWWRCIDDFFLRTWRRET